MKVAHVALPTARVLCTLVATLGKLFTHIASPVSQLQEPERGTKR